jgi:hypothetical protein
MRTVQKREERRRFFRLDGKYLLQHERFTIPRGAAVQEDTAKNISANGLLFESRTPYDLGTVLRLELLVQGIDKFKTEFYKHERLSNTEPLIVLGKVSRVEAVGPKLFDIGVSLVGLDYVCQRALAKYIDAHVKRA